MNAAAHPGDTAIGTFGALVVVLAGTDVDDEDARVRLLELHPAHATMPTTTRAAARRFTAEVCLTRRARIDRWERRGLGPDHAILNASTIGRGARSRRPSGLGPDGSAKEIAPRIGLHW